MHAGLVYRVIDIALYLLLKSRFIFFRTTNTVYTGG